jgi:hypothetical protein
MVSSQQESVFEKMPTLFAPINQRFKFSKDGKSLDVPFAGQWLEKPHRTVLQISPVAGISRVTVNGKHHAGRKQIELNVL